MTKTNRVHHCITICARAAFTAFSLNWPMRLNWSVVENRKMGAKEQISNRNYVSDLATAQFGQFFRVLLRWEGGLWKTVYAELLVWIVVFIVFSIMYRFGLSDQQKESFAKVVSTCYDYESLMPLTFLLGFYVQLIVGRWWSVIEHMGITDDMALTVAGYLRGLDENSMRYKRTIIRYMLVFQLMIYRSASTAVKKEFPTLKTLVDRGYLTQKEREQFSEHEFWLPVQWAISLAVKARDEKLIKSDHFCQHIIHQCESFQANQRVIWIFSWVNVPLAYTQVLFVCVRLFFIFTVIGRQYVNNDQYPLDIYVPVSAILQFIFYMGWLKVAEALLNPFGSDDDDFAAVTLLENNKRTALLIVDPYYFEPPPLVEDKFSRDERQKQKAAEDCKRQSIDPFERSDNPNRKNLTSS